MPFDDALLGTIACLSISNFGCVIPFGAEIYESFVNISYLTPCLD